MQNLFIHIGHPKTGTSTLQKFLERNRETLKSMGYLYPVSGWDPVNYNHNYLSRMYYQWVNFEDRSQERWVALKKEIFTEQTPNVVISSELFCMEDDPQWLDQLTRDFNIRIIYYIRKQDEYLESYYNQCIRMNPQGLLVEDINRIYRKLIPEYLKIIQSYEKYLGRENLAIRIFDKNNMVKGDIIFDFLNVIGINQFENFDYIVSQNASIKTNYLLFLRQCNALPLYTNEKTAIALDLMELSDTDRIDTVKPMLTADNCKMIMEICTADNQVIAREYVKTSESLFPLNYNNQAAGVPNRNLELVQQNEILEKASKQSQNIIRYLMRRYCNGQLPQIPEADQAWPGFFQEIEIRRRERFEAIKVSIIVYYHNSIDLARDCLNRILAEISEYDLDFGYEIIMLDDASDEIYNFENEKLHLFSNLRVVRNEAKLGFFISCNRIRKGLAPYIIFVESLFEMFKDHWWREAITVLDRDSEVGMVLGLSLYWDFKSNQITAINNFIVETKLWNELPESGFPEATTGYQGLINVVRNQGRKVMVYPTMTKYGTGLYELSVHTDLSHFGFFSRKPGRKRVLFGASAFGVAVTEVLAKYSIGVDYFCDNNPYYWGKEVVGIPVIAPSELQAMEEQVEVLITSMYYADIARQLKNMGIAEYMFLPLA